MSLHLELMTLLLVLPLMFYNLQLTCLMFLNLYRWQLPVLLLCQKLSHRHLQLGHQV